MSEESEIFSGAIQDEAILIREAKPDLEEDCLHEFFNIDNSHYK